MISEFEQNIERFVRGDSRFESTIELVLELVDAAEDHKYCESRETTHP